MQEAVSQPVGVRVPMPSAVTAPQPRAGRRASVAELWGETIRVMAAHSLPILACALAGFAGPGMLGVLVNAALTLDVYVRTGGITSSYASTFYTQLLVQSALGLFTAALARGAITWIALHGRDGRPASLREALRGSYARWPMLLFSSILYGGLITLGVAGLTLLLRQLRLDVTNIGRVGIDYDGVSRVVGVRVLNGLIPDAGAPFDDLIAYARYLLRRSSTSYYWLYAFRAGLGDVPLRVWLIGLGGLALMGGAGVLLRLRTAAILAGHKADQWAALGEGVRLGAGNWQHIAMHVWVVWIAGTLTNALFVIVPVALAEYLLVPRLVGEINRLWPYPVSALLFAVATGLVGLVLMAFSAVYDARLYLSLHPSHTFR
jgi:hypothetical protein